MPDTPQPRDFNRYPMLWIGGYFAFGIALAYSLDLALSFSIAAALVLLVLCIVMRDAACIILPVIFIPLGAICYEIETRLVSNDRLKTIYTDGRIESGEPVEIEGVLLGPTEPGYGGIFLTLRVERLVYSGTAMEASGNLRLFAPSVDDETAAAYARLDLRYGSRLRIMCRPEREERFRNPGVASRLEMLDRQGIDATGIVKSPRLIEKIGDDPVFLPLAWVYEQRQRMIDAFRSTFSAPTAGVLSASLLGNKNFLDRQTADVFREGGTFHVLVISGLHITFIGGVTLWFLSCITRRKLWQYLVTGMFLWAYTLAVGAEVPVVRASLMFSFLLLSSAIYRSGNLTNAFAACALLLLVWRPTDLLTASFQLTVISVAAIVTCAFPLIEKLRAVGSWTPTIETPLPPNVDARFGRFCEVLYWNETGWRIENRRQIWSANLFKSSFIRRLNVPNLQSLTAYLFEGVLVSVIVQIWMLPLLVIHFHRITPGAILLNLWVGAFLALVSFAGVAAVFLDMFSSWLSAPLIELTELFNWAMISVPRWFTASRLTGFRSPVYSGGSRVIYVGYFIAVAIASVKLFKWDPFGLVHSRKYKWGSIARGGLTLVLGLAIIFHPFSEPIADGRLRIDFLDVGQGDSALVTFPNGETMLVDGGGQVDYRSNEGGEHFEPDKLRIGEAVVSAFLWEKGYSHVDYLVATHSDADHMQGLVDVTENFDVGEILIGREQPDDPEFAQLLGVADRREIRMTKLGRNDQLTIGGAIVEVLNPAAGEVSSRTSANNSSLVIRIVFGSWSFLLTGDIEMAAENEMILAGRQSLGADVIKVAHHGSRSSSTKEFVEASGAGVAVISVGRRSRFGHPHPEVVERWMASGAEIMTTGEKGTITVSTDGFDLQKKSFVP